MAEGASSRRIPRPCTLAYWHHPRFSSGEHGNSTATQAIWQDLYDAARMSCSSATTTTTSALPRRTPTGVVDRARGIREFVVGTGGRSHYAIGTAIPTARCENSDTFGVLQLTLHPASLRLEVRARGRDGTFTDSGTGYCH